MSKELKISNVLDKHLSPIQIDGATVPIEISTELTRFTTDVTFAEDINIEGQVNVLGGAGKVAFTEGLEINAIASTGYINFYSTGINISANQYTGIDSDVLDNDSILQLTASPNYDSVIKFFNSIALKWSIANDGSDSDILKFDNQGAVGAATKLALDSDGNSKQEGSVSLKEKASAIADTAAYGQLWVKNATPNELYFTTDAGDDIQLTDGTSAAGGGGGGSSTIYWHQMVSGYRTNNNSSTNYYTYYRMWYENWSNSDSNLSSIADSDSYATFFIAPRAGTVTNMKIQGYASDTGFDDPFKFYIYKGAMSNNADSVSLTSMVNSGSITPPAINKTFSHTVDFSSDNAFAEDDCLYIWLKKDSTSANQDLYFNINVNGEYS